MGGGRIAIIGAGAAGLATARVFSRCGDVVPVVMESSAHVGGLWKYEGPNKEGRPVYRGLRTNLPRELMAFREKPWGGESTTTDSPSFVTHSEVQAYLEEYADQFDLRRYVRHGCTVTRLSLVNRDDDNNGDWPRVKVRFLERDTTTATSTTKDETFDGVCVCNGHFVVPTMPTPPLVDEDFRGKVMHSVDYDNPAVFEGMTVLCVGGRASGADLAREISASTKGIVYLSDSSLSSSSGMSRYGDVVWAPRTEWVEADGTVHFQGGHVSDRKVDAVIFCTGYEYDFPFLRSTRTSSTTYSNDDDEDRLFSLSSSSSSLEDLEIHNHKRRVGPLYEHLWHARYPSVAFVGLPQSVVPFPLFELQAEALEANFRSPNFPSLAQRMGGARQDFQKKEKTHWFDEPGRSRSQWDYCQRMADLAFLDDKTVEAYLATNRAIYDHAKAARAADPPGADHYRQLRYVRRDERYRRIFADNNEETRIVNDAELFEVVAH